MNIRTKPTILLSTILTPTFYSLAAGQTYQPLQNVKLPNGGGNLFNPNIVPYLQNIFSFSVAIAGGLAVIMIVIGGIKYMMSEAITDKGDAKDQIQSAVKGLLIALTAYVLLYTINPDLVKLRFNITSVSAPSGGTAPTLSTGGLTPGGSGGVAGGGSGSGGTLANNSKIVQNPDGSYSLATNILALDTDGTTNPGIDPTTHQGQTSLPGLDSTKDLYVVVPNNSPIPLGSNVLITNPSTGQQAWAIVGDHGGAQGYGEVSIAVSNTFGLYNGKDAISGDLNFQYFPKKQ